MIEEHKWRYLQGFLSRTAPTGKSLDHYLRIVTSMEGEIRRSYSESTDRFGSSDLVRMVVLDVFFVLELFRKAARLVRIDSNDPIFTMVWMSPFLMRDFLRLENQIPFFVLQRLFDESREDSDPSLTMLVLEFFNRIFDRPREVLEKYKNLERKHLLDFFRKSYIKRSRLNVATREGEQEVASTTSPFLKMIHPASKLVVAGVKFKAKLEAESFLDIEFRSGFFEIPQINMDDLLSSFFLNCVAFEQCYFNCSKDITSYVVLLGCLINTPADAGLLSDHKIIENYFGTDEEVARFFNDVGKDIAFDIKKNYLTKLFMDVNEYYMNNWHVGWAAFKHRYFDTPWSLTSALAAFILLFLTIFQALMAAYAYVHPPPQLPP